MVKSMRRQLKTQENQMTKLKILQDEYKNDKYAIGMVKKMINAKSRKLDEIRHAMANYEKN